MDDDRDDFDSLWLPFPTASSITSASGMMAYDLPTDLDLINSEWEDLQDTDITDIIRCECGSESIGTPFHSDYCPKHEDIEND